MKKIIYLMTCAAFLALGACGGNSEEGAPQPLVIDNALTDAEKECGLLTPEVMWKMGRVGGQKVSPDGRLTVFTITYYDMAENKGTTGLYLMPTEGGDVVRLAESGAAPAWSSDSRYIYYMDGGQVWKISPDGKKREQLTDIEGIESYGIAPSDDIMFYTKKVHVVNIKGSDLYAEADKSKARIYDDLMCATGTIGMRATTPTSS